MKNPALVTANGIPEAISNLYYQDNCNVMMINDAVEDSTTGAELVKNLNGLKLFSKFSLDRETPEYARLVTTDCFGNKHYFKAEK